jgi:hypothetical protein
MSGLARTAATFFQIDNVVIKTRMLRLKQVNGRSTVRLVHGRSATPDDDFSSKLLRGSNCLTDRCDERRRRTASQIGKCRIDNVVIQTYYGTTPLLIDGGAHGRKEVIGHPPEWPIGARPCDHSTLICSDAIPGKRRYPCLRRNQESGPVWP